MFADVNGSPVAVTCNRGVSGIDGTISSAAGFATARKQPVTLLIGDLAFLHDLNSLIMVPALPRPFIIVLINNGGGGIFSFLPIAGFTEVFEPFFGTPHTLSFEHAARLFAIEYRSPETGAEFVKTYRSLVDKKQSAIIEVRTDRQANFELHQQIFKKIIANLENSD